MAATEEARTEREDCDDESEEENFEDCELWTTPLEELGDMVDVFDEHKLQGKTILDVGTDGVKPLYIALKYEPHKVIGITTWKRNFASAIAENSKLLTETLLHFATCDFFDDNRLAKIMKKVNVKSKFDFILVTKTLHHLRTGECIAVKRGGKHRHREDEKNCIYEFKAEEILERFFQYGEKVIIQEWFDPNEKDDDKVRGKGGYFTIEELETMLSYLSSNYKVELFKPKRCHLTEKNLKDIVAKLKHEADLISFCVEKP